MPQLFSQSGGLTLGIKQQSEYEGYAVTASDSVDLQFRTGANPATFEPCTAIYVTGAGNVNVNLAGGGTAVLTSLSAGQIVRVNASRILATSTTATGIFALYPAGSL